DVVKFINYNGGAIYISNEYTELTLNKLWSNEEGGAATPKEGSVTFELYRQAYRLEYSTITVNVKSLGGVWSKKIKVAKSSGATIAVSGNWNVKYTVTYNGEVSQVSAVGATATYTIGQTSGDAVVEFTSDTWVTPEIQFSDYNQPTVKIKVGESQKMDTVDLNAGNRWSYTWSSLPKEDSSGNELRYSVVETSTGNYTVRYLNNEGIQTGVITVTNVVKGSYILPETGGNGRAGYSVLGLLLMLISLFYWYRIKCRHEKINQTSR
ncbi:MAG: Cna B-type domain-containing protein, partial [Eubacterium sp.]|nr:Cna B-type domain-containing protein [Eubacterium sp.]